MKSGRSGIKLRLNQYTPLRAELYIEIPSKIRNTESIVNVNNNNQLCFKYAILAKFVKKDAQRVSTHKNEKLEGKFVCNISFPVQLRNIHKYQLVNEVSIFGLDDEDYIYQLKVAKKELEDHRDLLIISKNEKSLYCYIKNFPMHKKNS